jgi:hypothetical protein
MAWEPILDEQRWRALDGKSAKKPKPLQTKVVRARNRRWAVVLGAVSFSFLLLALVLLSVDLYDGVAVCGNAISPTGMTDSCESSVQNQRVWVVMTTAMSALIAAAAFRLRWGPAWTEVRIEDRDGQR